jgi:MFS transporter, YNFM family, putative membrane transport protein
LAANSLIVRGTPAFHRTNLALFSAGFATFALMYCVQPLLPLFARVFHVSAAASSLAISSVTGSVAVAILLAGSVSEAWGRKSVMTASMFSSAILTTLSPLAPGWSSFLAMRGLEGIAFSGLPAVAMAYLAEEMHPGSVGLAMGLYVGGTAVGGMSGRLIIGILTDLVGWRWALSAVGAIGLIAAFIFWRSLPPSSHFRSRPMHLGGLLQSFGQHLAEPGLRLLFLEGFLLMGAFVSVYNYIGFRLIAPPYLLSHAEVGSVFAVYLVGTVSSAWVGSLAGRLGRRNVFWSVVALMLVGLVTTLCAPLAVVILGLALFTFGFFAAHSVLSSWVGLRARHSKAQASALYLFFYYVGSSVAGTAGGWFWKLYAWTGVVAFLAALLLLALIVSIRLTRLQPLPTSL